MKIKIPVFLVVSVFLFSNAVSAFASVVVPSNPIENGQYYNDESLPVLWPAIGVAGPITLSLRTEAQESLPPSSGGIKSVNLSEGTTEFTFSAFEMSLLTPNKYKIIIVCGEELCGESGYFDVKVRPIPPEVDGGSVGGADQNTNPDGFLPKTDGGNTGGADQNTNLGGFVPETDGGNTGGADQNTNLGGLVPDTDGENTGGADTGLNDQNQEQNQQEAAQENSRSSGGTSGSSKKPVALALTTAPKLPSLTDIGSCIYIRDYLNIRGSNNPTEVTKLQTFLLNTERIDVPVNGVFDQETFDAVKVFQTKYLDDIMTPWGLEVASGVVSYTTKKKINEIYCKTTFSLTPEQLAAIESYKNRQTQPSIDTPETFTAPEENIEVGFAQPEETVADEAFVETEQPIEIPTAQQTQTASALDAGGGFFEKIVNFFKRIF